MASAHGLDCDVLVVGGGCGGVAAALSAALLGRRVVLTEATGWLGGQLTAQAVPPDENPWVETTGSTASYRLLRSRVRDRYRADPRLGEQARARRELNPGEGWVSALCAEPVVVHDVLTELLRPLCRSGNLTIRQHHVPVSADTGGDRVEAVAFTAPDGPVTLRAAHVIDATEEGDLLPLTGCEHVLGAESEADTGEPHALPGPADPFDQQALTWCVALEHGSGEHVIERPRDYDFWRGYRAPFWPGPQLGWATQEPETGRTLRRPLFGEDGEQDLWRFRRIRSGRLYDPPLPDVSLVNWPQIDYWLAPVTGVGAAERDRRLEQARQLTLSFVYWLQTEAPRPDGGAGYPWLRPAGEPLGTADGLAAAPYIREARRIRAEFTVLEQHVGVEAREGLAGAEQFPDSAGIGSYRIDLHPSTGGSGYLDIACYPFQIPLGALIPQRLDNLLAGGKCLGVTHLTNGCYRLHPVEWNTGEAAGALAAFALESGVPPRAVRARPDLLAEFQRVLTKLGIPLEWPEDVRTFQR
ncbi:FAD-dependent oxidoreductase [Prauserella muralis]|uniref:FAD-dependent oxidoreductase n=1 Tax=Prauserella muralis TaxID=588067 RepID=A0A2V4B491_9PSEU|nr:FAD-dependent oxidoreductase [Prauserella muralis]PXY27955.1 FAD-dependent oxidoreductase [Prauserella muralis]TWE22259.1 FAD dependent oxidoreductase [Prauserella muralis]